MEKQLLPLALLHADEEQSVDGITRLQKLIFLAQEESEEISEKYDFEAGKYGPYSRPLYDDVDRLVEDGFILESIEINPFGDEKQVYELTDKGKRAVQNADLEFDEFGDIESEMEEIKETYNDEGFWDLLEYVYETYPEMAVNSELNI